MNVSDFVEKVFEINGKYPIGNDDMKGNSDMTNYNQKNAEYRTIAKDFLKELGIEVDDIGMIEVFPHILTEDGDRKTASIVVGTQKYPGSDQVNCYENAKWYEVDPLKPEVDIQHLPK